MTATSATDRAYEYLHGEILSCRLAPGSRIIESAIAEQLEMSNTPVKRALGMLINEGFVEVQPRHGYRVTEITLADVQEIYQLRQIVEPAAAELAATKATPEQLREMRELVEPDPDSSYEDRTANVLRFHQVLAEASGSLRLAAVLNGLLDETQRLLHLGLALEDNESHQAGEHRELLDALLKGNHHLAREIAEHQVEVDRMRMFEAILTSLTSSGRTAERVVLSPVEKTAES